MVGSSGSNNCWISLREISPWFSFGKQLYPFGISWFDPLDPTIVRSGGSNHGFPRENNYIPLGYHGSILFLTCPVVFVRDPTIISLNPFSAGQVRYHGWILRIEQLLDPKDRTMVFLRKTIISRRDIMRKGKVS